MYTPLLFAAVTTAMVAVDACALAWCMRVCLLAALGLHAIDSLLRDPLSPLSLAPVLRAARPRLMLLLGRSCHFGRGEVRVRIFGLHFLQLGLGAAEHVDSMRGLLHRRC